MLTSILSVVFLYLILPILAVILFIVIVYYLSWIIKNILLFLENRLPVVRPLFLFIRRYISFFNLVLLTISFIVIAFYFSQTIYLLFEIEESKKILTLLGIDSDFLQGALTGLGGNIITFVAFLVLSLFCFFLLYLSPRQKLINFFGITRTNTTITILISNNYIKQQIPRRTKTIAYEGYRGNSLAVKEYIAARNLKEQFQLNKPLVNVQGLFNILENSFLEFHNIRVEIDSAPNNQNNLETIFEQTRNGERSLVVIGSPVNNQFTEFLFFGQFEGQPLSTVTITPTLALERRNFLTRIGYDIRTTVTRTERLYPLRFIEYIVTLGSGRQKTNTHIRLREDDNFNEKEGEYCGLIQRIPIKNQAGDKTISTITIFAGWDDVVSSLMVNNFIDEFYSTEIQSLINNTNAFPLLLFKADQNIGNIKDKNGYQYYKIPFSL